MIGPVTLPWSGEDDVRLVELHGKFSISEIACKMGRTTASIRGRVTRLGIAKKEYWTDSEVQGLVRLYEEAGVDGVLGLEGFASSIGKLKSNVCRKARELGLSTSLTRKKVEERKNRRKFDTDAERYAHKSASVKKWIAENGHPRGMLGKSHTDETKIRISQTSKAYHLFATEDQISDRIMKAMKTKVEGYGSVSVPRQKTTWAAGWREIGGYRKYYRSRWEANYARYLQWLKDNGQIKDWKHEPETYWFNDIKRGVRSYLPDFRVWENDGRVVLHEVKGWMDSRSKTTLKRMKKYYPSETVLLIDEKAYKSIRRSMMPIIPDWEDSERDRR